MLNTRRYIGVAIISALAASMLFFTFLQRLNARAAARIAERIPAVVVAKQAEPGQFLTENMLTIKRFPPSNLPQNAVLTTEDAIGQTASVRLYPGEVLLQDRIGAVAQHSAAGSVPRDHLGEQGHHFQGNREVPGRAG